MRKFLDFCALCTKHRKLIFILHNFLYFPQNIQNKTNVIKEVKEMKNAFFIFFYLCDILSRFVTWRAG